MHRYSVGPGERLFWLGPEDPLRMTPTVELEWEVAPDDASVERALDYLYLRHPLLTCRLVRRWGRCWWEGPHGDPAARAVVRKTLPSGSGATLEDRRNALRDALHMEPVRPEHGELFRIFRIALPNGGEWWLISIHEMVTDGRGWMEVIDELLGYMRSDATAPEPDARPRRLGKLPRRDWRQVRRHHRSVFPGRLESPWPQLAPRAPRRFRGVRFEAPVLERLRSRGRQLGATLTDVNHALIARALESAGGFRCRRDGEEWLRICFLVDLRRLADGPVGLASFVGMGALTLPCPLERDLSALIREVARQKEAFTNEVSLAAQARLLRLAGLVPLSMVERVNRRMLLTPGGVSTTVSSIGSMDRMLSNARNLPIVHAGASAFPHPSVPFVLAVGSFRGVLTMAASFVDDEFDAQRRGEILGCIRDQIETFAD